MKEIKKLRTLIRILLGWAVYGLSFFVPRNKKIWVFVGWHQNKEREIFAENPKYLFLYASNNQKDIRPIWIGQDNKICTLLKNHGYEAYSITSAKGMYFSLRAGYTFIGSTMQRNNWKYSGASKVIQLWHGKSLKKTGHNSPYSIKNSNKFISPNLFRRFTYFIAMSNYMADFIVSDFQMERKDVIVTGLPKFDVLFGDVKGAEIDLNPQFVNEIRKAKSKNFKKLIFYAPTFRPDGSNPMRELDLPRLNKFLEGKNYFVIASLHPKFSTRDWMPKIQFTNISFVESGYDIYPLIYNFDLLITDYSSLSIEFLLVDKPTIFFVYDLEKFKQDMGIYDDLWSVMPGSRVKTFDELIAILENTDTDGYKKARASARQKLFDFFDSNASKRIIEKLLDQL
ncbi:MAG: CDP-glycerol glycerophosphotransferase family protein [Candidatus Spechtbacterales bacterium]